MENGEWLQHELDNDPESEFYGECIHCGFDSAEFYATTAGYYGPDWRDYVDDSTVHYGRYCRVRTERARRQNNG